LNAAIISGVICAIAVHWLQGPIKEWGVYLQRGSIAKLPDLPAPSYADNDSGHGTGAWQTSLPALPAVGAPPCDGGERPYPGDPLHHDEPSRVVVLAHDPLLQAPDIDDDERDDTKGCVSSSNPVPYRPRGDGITTFGVFF
jgi:hypothetical protein